MSLLATMIGKLMALSSPLKLTKSEDTERMAASETGVILRVALPKD